MAFTLSFDRASLRAGAEPMKRTVLTALRKAVTEATDKAKGNIRTAIRARTTSTRLPNIIGSKIFPEDGRLTYEPTGSIFPRGKSAENIFRQLGEGAVIRVRNKKALAIPLHNRRNGRGSLLPPSAFPGLVYIPSKKGGNSIGVLALPTSKTRSGKLKAKDRRALGATSRARVQQVLGEEYIGMFVLVKAATIPKALDVPTIMRAATAVIPAAFQRALRGSMT